jgi:predicted transcriptional regulator
MRTTTKQVVSTRVPRDWAVQLQQLAEAEGCDISKVVADAIAEHLKVHSPESVESLSKRVARLERSVKRLLVQ